MTRSSRYWLILIFVYGLQGSVSAENETGRYRIEFASYLGGSESDDLREIIQLRSGSLLLGGKPSRPIFRSQPAQRARNTAANRRAGATRAASEAMPHWSSSTVMAAESRLRLTSAAQSRSATSTAWRSTGTGTL